MKEELRRITIPAGSIVHICGLPFYAVNNTEVESHPANIAMLSGPQEHPLAKVVRNLSRPWWKRLLRIA
jgi:hypothetical protein